MPTFGTIRASKGGRVQVNTPPQILSQSEWRATWRGDDVDTSNFESAGFEQGTIGFQVIEFSSNGFWNDGLNPFGSPPAIYPSDNLPNVNLYIHVADPQAITIPLARILSSEVNTGNLKTGAVQFNFHGKSNGSFAIPPVLSTTNFTGP